MARRKSELIRPSRVVTPPLLGAGAAIGIYFFWSLFVAGVVATLSLVYLLAGLALLISQGVKVMRSQEESRTRSKRSQAQQKEYLERARTWQFSLVELPLPEPGQFFLGKLLTGHPRLRKRLLLQAATPPEIPVTIRFRPYGVRLQAPITHQVGSLHLYESSLEVGTPCVSFPQAQVGSDGRIVDYGPEAVLYGCHIGLPEPKDDLAELGEEPWLWQVRR
jgi:hypothetical protein